MIEKPEINPYLFGKYCLLERVSVGGMAEVFRAKPFDIPDFRGYLALKRILPHLAEDEEFIKMFIDEAKLTVNLQHPNIIRTYELGQFHNSYYILMEYISGRDLLGIQKQMRRTKQIMSVHASVYIAHGAAMGLHYAHNANSQDGTPLNLIHRDISPQNILLSYSGSVKVIDFGIAKAVIQSTKTQVGILKGKMGYMSPEQVLGNTFDSRSDLFALGTVLWEMLTNRRLFSGANEFETMKMVQDPQVPPPSSVNPLITPELDNIVARALNPNPDQRFQSGEEFAIVLSQYLTPDSPKVFASWFQSVFSEELERERYKHQAFTQIRTPEDVHRLLNQGFEEVVTNQNLWDAEIAPNQDEDFAEFANEHTVIQAGGFEVDLLELDTAELDLLTIEEGDLVEIEGSEIEALQNRTVFQQEKTDRHKTMTDKNPQKTLLFGIFGFVFLALISAIGSAGYYYFAAQETVLVVTSIPNNISVNIDGEFIGNTPLNMNDFERGSHQIEAKMKGFSTFNKKIEVVEKYQEIEIILDKIISKRGKVVVSSATELPEDAVFFIDGNETEIPGNNVEFSLAKGEHLFEVFAPNFRPFYKIATLGEKLTLVEIELISINLPFSVLAPDGVKAEINGEIVVLPDKAQLSPKILNHIKVRKKSGRVNFYLDLLLLKKGGVDIETTDPKSRNDFGWLMMPNIEKYWNIYIDGINSGIITPISVQDRIPILAGQHMISLKRGRSSFDFHLKIDSQQNVTIRKKIEFVWEP